MASPSQLMLADNGGTQTHERLDGRRIWIHQIKVNAVLGLLLLGHLVEIPGWLLPLTADPADRGKIRVPRPWTLRAATQVGRPISLSVTANRRGQPY